MARAYVQIDNGLIVVGNDWIERRWTELTVKTVELRQKLPGGYVEWVSVPGPDLRLDKDGVPLRLALAGTPDWSESYDELGASVTMRRIGAGWMVRVQTTALHDHPGLVRTVEMANLGGEAFTLTSAAMEVMALRRDGAGVLTHDFARRSAAALWQTDACAAAAELSGHGRLGLVLGMETGGRYELFDPDPALCALALAVPVLVPSGRTVRLGRTFLFPYAGDPGPALQRTLGGLLRSLHEGDRREREQAADTA